MKFLRLILVVLVFFSFLQNASSAFVPVAMPAAKPKTEHKISAQEITAMKEFVTLSPKQYGELRGKKLSLVEKVEFKIVQKKLKKQLSYYDGDGSEGFNFGGFALGFFLGLIGALLSFISKDRNFRKWAWIGFGSWVVLLLIIVAIAA